jgi:hypothetical protein
MAARAIGIMPERAARSIEGGEMKETPLTADAAMALLRKNAERIAELANGVAPELLQTAPETDEWSPNDVLAHIRACCDVWGRNIARIIANDHPTFAGMNPRTWMKRTDYPERQFREGLHAFTVQREELLKALAALPSADWERTATVTSYGQSNERTLRSYASQLAMHEREHVRQIERAVTVSGPSR